MKCSTHNFPFLSNSDTILISAINTWLIEIKQYNRNMITLDTNQVWVVSLPGHATT